jgi:hypothetical protein
MLQELRLATNAALNIHYPQDSSRASISQSITTQQLQQIFRLVSMSSLCSGPETDTCSSEYPLFTTEVLASHVAGANQGVFLQVAKKYFLLSDDGPIWSLFDNYGV